MKAKYLCAVLALLLCVLAVATGCQQASPPALEEVYDAAVDLIERSYAVNDILFGYGLPVWKQGSSYAEVMSVYMGQIQYETTTPYSIPSTADRIRTMLSSVYSSSYVESLTATLFDGYAYEEGAMAAQLKEDSKGLHQYKHYTPLVTWQRIYDYSTMRVVGGDERTAILEIDSHLENEQTVLTVELVLVLEDDGWRLDTPTY